MLYRHLAQLADAGTEEDPALCTLCARVRWEDLDRVHRLARELGASAQADYVSDPENALLTLTLEEKNRGPFIRRLTEQTAGRGVITEA